MFSFTDFLPTRPCQKIYQGEWNAMFGFQSKPSDHLTGKQWSENHEGRGEVSLQLGANPQGLYRPRALPIAQMFESKFLYDQPNTSSMRLLMDIKEKLMDTKG